MHVKEWMVMLFLSTLGLAAIWGGSQSKAAAHEARLANIESWKDTAILQMGNMDGKLDALLMAQGVDYQPIKKRGR